MKFILYKDETINADLPAITANLNRLCSGITFEVGKTEFCVRSEVVSNPASYNELSPPIKGAAKNAELLLLATKKPYDNNYFWDSPSDDIVIMSFSGWETLTNLSINSGVVYFVCLLMANLIGLREDSHHRTTGCIGDFLWDKRGVDIGMRSAFICPKCLKEFRKNKLPDQKKEIYESLLKLLNNISESSRNNLDILEYWQFKSPQTDFDVFLCHNSEEKNEVRTISKRLKTFGIRPWFDEEQLRPGISWQNALEQQIETIKTAAVFVGTTGIGPWHRVEIRAFLEEFVRRQCPVIPVILPRSKTIPKLPIFLRQMQYVDFRRSHPNPLEQLVWGITGRRPV